MLIEGLTGMLNGYNCGNFPLASGVKVLAKDGSLQDRSVLVRSPPKGFEYTGQGWVDVDVWYNYCECSPAQMQ